MRKIIICLLLIAGTVSCTKSVHTADKSQTVEPLASHVTEALESPDLTRDLGGSVLKITAEPNVVCYSYNDGETPKPCNIFVAFNCTLSNPLDRYVKVEIVKNNIVSNNKEDEVTDSTARLVIVIAPHTTRFTLVSALTTRDNNHIPEGEFKISNVSWYTKID